MPADRDHPVDHREVPDASRHDRALLRGLPAGTLPSVSFVDPEVGVISEIGKALSSVPGLGAILARLKTGGGDRRGTAGHVLR